MQITDFKASNTLTAMLPVAFVFAGVVWSPLFFAGAFLAWGVQAAKKNKPLGIGIAAFGILYFIFVFGFGVGKDLARRDIANQSNPSTLGSP